jgi:magnesium-transporting ATPase (P-type)
VDLVVGDIITIEAGMRIPADCILLEGMDIKCDESMYYAYNKEVEKKISID